MSCRMDSGGPNSKVRMLTLTLLLSWCVVAVSSGAVAGDDDNIQDALDAMIQDLEDRYSDFQPDDFWHPYVDGTENREVVRVKNVSKTTLNIGSYSQWKYARLGLKHYLIGIANRNLDVFGNDFIKIDTLVHEDDELVALAAFTRWNEEENNAELVILTATSQSRLNLYEFKNNKIKLIRSFPLHYSVESIEVCHVGMSSKVVLVPKNSGVEIDIYNIEVSNSTQIWFFQRIPTQGSATIVVYDSDMLDSVIAVAENNHLDIYTFDLTKGLFDISQSVEIPNPCRRLFTFTFAYKHYIGCVPTISINPVRFVSYNYNKNEYVVEEQDATFANIATEEVYPISVPDYTDQFFLLVRDSQGVMRILIYHGGQAGFVSEYFCRPSVDENCDHSMLHRGVGFSQYEHSSFIFSGAKGATDVWKISKEVLDFLSPVVEESRQLYNSFQELAGQFEEWDKSVLQIVKTLNNSIKTDEANTVQGSWDVDNLSTSHFIPESGEEYEVSTTDIIKTFTFLNTEWEDKDFDFPLSEVQKLIQKLKTEISAIASKMSDAVMMNDPETQLIKGVQTVSGHFDAQRLMALISTLGSIADTTDAKSFFDSLLSQSKDLRIDGSLVFQNSLNVSQLNAYELNDISVSDIARYSKENIFKCPVQFSNGINVEGNAIISTVNGVNLKEEIMMADNITGVTFLDGFVITNNTESSGDYNFEKVMLRSSNQVVSSHITFSDMEITTPLTLKNINGDDFSQFLSSLITTGSSDIITGKKTVRDGLSAEYLRIGSTWNNQAFPNDFIRNKQTRLVLYGTKSFSTVNANKVNVLGLLDGKSVNDFVPRTLPMEINNTWTFTGPVTVIKDLPVAGLVDGVNVDELSHSGTLNTNLYRGDKYVAFADVEFEQDLIISDLHILQNVNDDRFEDAFGDLLVFNGSRCLIPGRTIVNSNISTDNLQIDSGIANGKIIGNFLTADKPQNITVDVTLSANCQFRKLQALQLFDGVDLENILENAVRLTGSNKIDWKTEFEHIKCLGGMVGNGSINGFNNLRNIVAVASGKLSQTFFGDLSFQKMAANNAGMASIDMPNGSKIGGLDIISWDNTRRRLSNDEIFGDPVEIRGYVKSSYDIFTSFINDISLDKLTNESFRTDVKNHTFTEPCIFNNTIVVNNGTIGFEDEVSGYSLNLLIEEGFPLNSSEYEVLTLFGNWHFEAIIVQENLEVDGSTCGVDLKALEYDAVRKGQANLRIGGNKRFLDIEVEDSIDTQTLNEKDLSAIFTLNGNQSINCPFSSEKNIVIEGPLVTDGSINDQFPTNELSSVYSNDDEYTHKIQGDYFSDYDVTMKNLQVTGTIKGVDLASYLQNLLTVDSDQLRFTEPKTFTSPVSIGKSSGAEMYNNIDLGYLEILRLNDNITIDFPVDFQGNVFAAKVIVNGGDVDVENIVGVNWADMIENGIRKDGFVDYRFGSLTFDRLIVTGGVTAENVQGFPFADYVSLDSADEIPYLKVKKLELKGTDLTLTGLINGRDLTSELANTVMRDDPYLDLKGNKRFLGTITVKEDLTCFGPEFQDQVVDITKPFNITKPIEFKQPVYIDKSFDVTKPIQGYTVDSIIAEALTKDDDQPISGQWEFTKGVTFKDDVQGVGELKNFDLNGLLKEKDFQIRSASSRIETQKQKYREECLKVHNATEELISNPMKLDAFDKHQSITLRKQVESIITIRSTDKMYLLSITSTCEITRYEWQNTTELFYQDVVTRQSDLRLGRIKAWQSASHGDFGLLVYETMHSDCSYAQPGVHFILLEVTGQFSTTTSLIQEPVTAFSLISDVYERNTALFVIMGDTLKVFKWGNDDQNHGFYETHAVDLSHKYERIEATLTANGVGLLLCTEDHIAILTYDWTHQNLATLAESTFLTSKDATIGIFDSYDILHALVPHRSLQSAETKWTTTMQVISASMEGDLTEINAVPANSLISKAIINFAGRIYVAFLSKTFGLSIYAFKGLSGLQQLNDYPIKIFNGIEVHSFEVRAWDFRTPRPFIMVLTKSAIEIFHSNVYGDSLDHNSKNLCRIK